MGLNRAKSQLTGAPGLATDSAGDYGNSSARLQLLLVSVRVKVGGEGKYWTEQDCCTTQYLCRLGPGVGQAELVSAPAGTCKSHSGCGMSGARLQC